MTRILVTGSGGQLGRQVVGDARRAGHDVSGLGRHEPEPCDLTDAAAVRALVLRCRPELIVHAGAWSDVDRCEEDPALAQRVNVDGTRHVVDAAAEVGAHVVYLSTDYVFDGTKDGPYVEADEPAPLSAYGRSKVAGEQIVGPDHTIVRTSWLCSAHPSSTVCSIVERARSGERLRFVTDQVGRPTVVADLSPVVLALGLDRAAGTWHATNQQTASWFELAQQVVRLAGLDPALVQPTTTDRLEPPRAARRPANSALDDAALRDAGRPRLPELTPSLRRLVDQLGR